MPVSVETQLVLRVTLKIEIDEQDRSHFRLLWMRGYDLDDEVQDEIANKIGAWFQQLKYVREVKIPRCL